MICHSHRLKQLSHLQQGLPHRATDILAIGNDARYERRGVDSARERSDGGAPERQGGSSDAGAASAGSDRMAAAEGGDGAGTAIASDKRRFRSARLQKRAERAGPTPAQACSFL